MSDQPKDGEDKPPAKGISFGLGGVGFGAPSAAEAQRDPADRDPDAVTARVVIVGPFAPPETHTTRSGRPGTASAVTRATLDDAIARLCGNLVLAVRDPFEASAPAVRLDLALTSLAAFRPDGLVEGCSVLRDLLAASVVARDGALSETERRSRLAGLLPPAWLARVVRAPAARLSPAAAAAPMPAPSAIDDLLSGFDLGDASPPAPAPVATPEAALLGSFVAATASDDAVIGAAPLLARALGDLLGQVLASEELRSCEAAFRGIATLTRQLPRYASLDLVAVAGDADDDVYGQAIEAALTQPADLVVVAQTVGADAASIGRAAALARIAEAHQTPVVLDVDPRALGVASARELVTSQRRLRGVTAPGPVALRALAAREETRWLLLCANRLIARPPLAGSSARLPHVDVVDRGGPLFAPAGFGVAALALASFAAHGHIGALSTARVEGLPAYTDTDNTQLVTEAASTDGALEDAGLAGFAVLASAAGRDTIALPHPRMAYRGSVGPSGTSAAAGSTLADQLLVSLVARGLREIAGALSRETPAQTVKEVVLLGLSAVMPSGEPRPALAVALDGAEIVVTLRPRGFAGCAIDEIELAAPLAAAAT